MENISREAEMKKNGLAANAQNAMDRGLDKTQQLGNSVEKFSHDLGTQVGSFAREFSDKSASYLNTTRKYVKENPVQSVAIAAATGIAVGSLFRLFRKRA